MAEDLITDYSINKRRSIEELKRRCRLHLSPFFAGRFASAITTAEVRRFIALRQQAGAANAEINRELAALKRAFSLAVQAGKLMHKPHIPMLQENNVRTGFFEREQFESVRHHLPENLRPMVTFAYITGWRLPSEILPLQWRQVDFQAGTVRLDAGATKNDEGRVFPFTQELRGVLESQKAKTDALQRQRGILCPWVFHRAGRPIRRFRGAWAAACKEAGLPGRIPHDFRRTAVRNLVRAGVSERVAMMMTGHKTRSVFERYNIVNEGDLRDAAARLDRAADTISDTIRNLQPVPAKSPSL
jgi:integrase